MLGALTPTEAAVAVAATLLAGFVKGAVGFAMPLIMVSGMTLVMPLGTAVGLMILPVLAANLAQVARAGRAEAGAALSEHRTYVVIVGLAILISAQLLVRLPAQWLLTALGVAVVILSAIQLSGWHPTIPPGRRWAFEWGSAGLAGTMGGLMGTWGPVTVLYLLALGVPRARSIAVQGVVYGTGSVMLLVGHVASGVFDLGKAALSLALLIPAFSGMWLGFRAGERMDAAAFRRLTLVVLIVAGLNLIRRGLA